MEYQGGGAAHALNPGGSGPQTKTSHTWVAAPEKNTSGRRRDFYAQKKAQHMKRSLLFLACLLTITGTFAQHAVGIFDDHMDIGRPKLSGDASYDAATQTYTVTGAGDNIWFNRDEFQFVYKKITGDFILTADFAFTGDTTGA